MTALTRWNPFEEMEAMQNRLSSLFSWAPVRQDASSRSEWTPLVDIAESDDHYVIQVDLPGVSKKDISVSLENGQLFIRGSRPADSSNEGVRVTYSERNHGAFSRTIDLPHIADASRIRANFKEGVLTIHVAKDEKAKPRLVEITG